MASVSLRRNREFMLQNAGSTATILAVAGWALLLAAGATLAPAFRHPHDLDGLEPNAKRLVANQ